MRKGFIHLYSGNGKGKTTAALGLTLRAAGAGMKSLIVQFVKGLPYSEHEALKRFPEITLKIFGRECFIVKEPEPADFVAAQSAWDFVKVFLQNQVYDIIVLDELNIALYYKLIDLQDIMTCLHQRTTHAEIIITGRYPPVELVDFADLHTEMTEHKHYYQSGVEARLGIEY